MTMTYAQVATDLCDALRQDNGFPPDEDLEMYEMTLAALVFDSDGDERRMAEWETPKGVDELFGPIWEMAAGERGAICRSHRHLNESPADRLDAAWPTVSEVLGFFVC